MILLLHQATLADTTLRKIARIELLLLITIIRTITTRSPPLVTNVLTIILRKLSHGYLDTTVLAAEEEVIVAVPLVQRPVYVLMHLRLQTPRILSTMILVNPTIFDLLISSQFLRVLLLSEQNNNFVHFSHQRLLKIHLWNVLGTIVNTKLLLPCRLFNQVMVLMLYG